MVVRLGEAIVARLDELGVTRREASDAGYVPRASLNRLLAGTGGPPHARRAELIERGLLWLPGSIDKLLAGGRPAAAGAHVDWPRTDRDWQSAVEQAWHSAADSMGDGGEPGGAVRAPGWAATASPEVVRAELRRTLGPGTVALTRAWPHWVQARVAETLLRAAGDPDLPGDPEALGFKLLNDALGTEFMPSVAVVCGQWARDYQDSHAHR